MIKHYVRAGIKHRNVEVRKVAKQAGRREKKALEQQQQAKTWQDLIYNDSYTNLFEGYFRSVPKKFLRKR